MQHEHVDVTVRTSLHYWSAVLSGVLIGVSIHLTMGMIGLALGLFVTGPADGQPLSASGLPAAVGAWWWLSSMVALVVAGAATGVMTRTEGFAQATLHGSIVWALAVLASAWIATTAFGTALSGAAGVILPRAGQPAQQIRIVVDTGSRGVALPSSSEALPRVQQAPPPQVTVQPHPPQSAGASDGALSSTLKTLSWYAVVQASRELNRPEVRELLRQYARAAWDETGETRRAIANQVSQWFDAGAQNRGAAFEQLRDTIVRSLLLSTEEAERLIANWRASLRSPGANQTSPADQAVGETAQRERPALTDEQVRAEVRRRIDQITGAFNVARAEMLRLVERSTFPGPEARAAAIQRIREAIRTTEAEAGKILARWQSQAQQVASELRSLAERAGRTAEDQTQAALFALSQVAGWVAISLLFGWMAATVGAYGGGRLAIRTISDPTGSPSSSRVVE